MKKEFIFQIIEPKVRGTFADQLACLKQDLRQWMMDNELTPAQLLFTRVYLSDAANQWGDLLHHPLYSCYLSVGAISCIEQPLLSGAKVALQLWFSKSKNLHKSGTPDCLEVALDKATLFFHAVRFAEEEVKGTDGKWQTEEAFRRHIKQLSARGLNLKDHCHRTWLYVRDIDRHYADVVHGRNCIFEQEGLTPTTHFIASTGIGGVCDNREAVVSVDFLSVDSKQNDSAYYLKALDYLNPTHEYGVAFERGTRLTLDDWQLFFISGTASIDKHGQCVHRGDVLTQCGRLFLNIDKLLNDGGASLDDVAYMIVYLRDIADYAEVNRYIKLRFPHVPSLIVEARVCRPEWLVEVECIAMKPIL